MLVQKERAHKLALSLLSRQQRSSKTLQEKLIEKGIDEQTAKETAAYMKEQVLIISSHTSDSLYQGSTVGFGINS